MLAGYMGRILNVDLSTGAMQEERPDQRLYRDFLGGYGVGARILFSRQRAGVAPLGPDNILGFVTGPLTGTPALSGTRYTVVGRSPLTGTWGDANAGGDFGPNLKFAGYDAVFFTGASEKPVYLFIEDGRAELRDAGHLWGKDTFEVEDALKGQLGEEARVCAIGPAGERLSLISCIMNNKGRAAGRSGLGAVMGSKRLKAVAVIGTLPVPLADKEKANDLRRNYLGKLAGPIADLFTTYGTPGLTAHAAHSGDSPVKNWGGIGVRDFPEASTISDEKVIELQQKKYACWRCPFGCGGHMKEGQEYPYAAGAHKPEYETLCAFGTLCLNNNLESIIMANDICNRYGLDTISTGCTIAFAIECYENGLITDEDTEGIELRWGNHRAIVAMTRKLAQREGFGDVLADGVRVAAEKIGKGAAKYAIHVGGQEIGMHDPKHAPSWATAYKLDATPGRHTQGGAHFAEAGWVTRGLDLPRLERYVYAGKGEAHRKASAWMHAVNASGMCMFMTMAIGATPVVEFLNAVTGEPYTLDDLLRIGERISALRQSFNVREGVNALRFKMPERVLGRPPQPEGPLTGVSIDEDTQMKDYVRAMDWDPVTAKPSKERLEELGLQDAASVLWPQS